MSTANTSRFFALLSALVLALPASAHPDASHHLSAFASGLLHPFTGADHLLAMLAAGMLATRLQSQSLSQIVLMLVFPLLMLCGAIFGSLGVSLAGAELMIALSVAVLGMLLAFSLRLSLALSASLLACFAIFHGYAHALERPEGSSILGYGAGFMVATALIQIAGLGLAKLWQSRNRLIIQRLAGGAIAAAGLVLLAT